MTLGERNAIIIALFNKANNVADTKGKAYSHEDDALIQFKEIAIRLEVSKYQVWSVFFDKHITSIMNAIRKDPFNPVENTESMEGRLIDICVYSGILQAMLKEDELNKKLKA